MILRSQPQESLPELLAPDESSDGHADARQDHSIDELMGLFREPIVEYFSILNEWALRKERPSARD